MVKLLSAAHLAGFDEDDVAADGRPDEPVKGVSIGDKIYAIPFEIELVGLYYDADVLAAQPDPPRPHGMT